MEAQERIKFIKEYLGGLSQKDLSLITNINIGTIAGIEKGTQQSFNYNLAVSINKVCKENGLKALTIQWMMSGEGERFEVLSNTLERRVQSIETLLKRTDNIGKRFDFIRTENNLSIEEYINILEITKERYLEICIDNKLLTMKEAILMKTNFNVTIDDFIFDEKDEIKKIIDNKSAFNNKITNLSPMQKASIKNSLKNK